MSKITPKEVDALSKALSCDGFRAIHDEISCKLLETLARLGLGKLPLIYGAILQVENIDLSKLIVQTFDFKDLKLWKDIGKKK